MSLDLGILLVYFAFLLGVGFVFSRMVKDGEDYFKSGGEGTWWLVGVSMFMAGISAYTFVGNAAGIFKSGWSPLAIYGANIAGFALGGFVLAAWYRQMRVVTVAEVLHARFGKATEQVVAILVVVNSLIWCGVVLYGLSVFGGLLFPDADPTLLIVGVGLIVQVYCTIGGSWAVMANDFIQGLILVSMTVLLTVLCLVETGGVGGFFDAIAADAEASRDFQLITPVADGADDTFWNQKYGLSWCIAAFLTQLLAQAGLFQGVRYFSAKDGRAAAQSSWLGGVLMLVGCVVFFVPAMYARLYLSTDVSAMTDDPAKAPEYAYAVASRVLLPNGMFSIMIVAMFAAAVSSMDTGLNRNAALIVRDILPALLRTLGLRPIPPERQVLAGRIATLGCGVFIIALALGYANLEGASLFDIMLTLISMFLAPQAIPLLLFLFLRRTAPWAALSSIAGGFAPSVVVLVTGWDPSYQVQTLVILAGAVAGYLVAIPFYAGSSDAYKRRVAAFYETMETPVDFATEVGAGSDRSQLLIIGRFGTALGLLLLGLLLLPNDASGRVCIAAVVGFVLLVSLTLWILGHRQANTLGGEDESPISNR